MTVSIANTALNNNFNSWRLNTNYMATVIGNNAVTVNPGGDANRGGYSKGDGHVDGTFSGTTLKTDTLKGGNTSVGGTLTIESNTHITGTATNFFTVDANTTFTANVSFEFDSATDRLILPEVDNIRIDSGSAGQFLRRVRASDEVEFKSLTMRDLTETTLDSAHLYLSGANTDFITNGDSTVLSFSNANDEIRMYMAGGSGTNGDSDLYIELEDTVGDSRLVIVNSSNTVVGYIGSDGDADFTGTLNVDGATTLNGAVTLGDASTDTIIVEGRFANQSTYGPAVFNGTTTFNNTMYINGSVEVGDQASDTLIVTSTSSMNGNTAIGSDEADTLTVNARVTSHLIANGAYDLGSSTLEWRDLYIDGTAHIDTLDVDETLDVAGAANFNDTTSSTSTTTGAVIVDGGVGIAENLNVGGTLTVTGESTFNGAINLGDAAADSLNIKATTTIENTASLEGNTAIGDTEADTLTVNARVTSHLVANTDSTDYNLGSPSLTWTRVYANTVSIANTIVMKSDDRTILSVTGELHANNAIKDGTVENVHLKNDHYSLAANTGTPGDIQLGDTLSIVSGDAKGITVDYASDTFTVSGVDATSTIKGVASFDSGDFSVSSGAVSLADSATGAVIGISATANETSVSRTDGTVTVGLADSVTVPDALTVTGDAEIGKESTAFTMSKYAGAGTTTVTGTVSDSNDLPAQGSVISIRTASGTEQEKLNGDWTVVSASGLEFEFIVDTAVAIGDLTSNIGTIKVIPETVFDSVVTFNKKVNIDSSQISLQGAATLSSVSVTGFADFEGDIDLGSSSTDTVSVNASVDTNIVPTGTVDLGESGNQWNDLYVDGTIYNGSDVIIGSNGTLHANNTIQANNIHGYMLEDTSVTDDLDNFDTDGAITQTTQFGSSTKIPVLTIDRKGRIIAAANADVAGVDSVSYTSSDQTLTVSLATGTNLTATIAAATANTDGSNGGLTNRGVASFNSTQFSVTDGLVSIGTGADAPVLTVNGTANEIETSKTDNTVTIGLPDDVTIAGQLSVSENVVASGNGSFGGNLTVSGGATITGDLTVSGTTTTISTTNMEVEDALIALQAELTGSNTNDIGIVFNRGSTGANAVFVWDESQDKFTLGTVAVDAAGTSGYLNVTKGELDATVDYTNIANFPTLDNYVSWTISDSTTTEAIGSGDTLKFGQDGTDEISVEYSTANNTMMITHDNVSRNNTNSNSTATHGGEQTVIDSITTNARGHVTDVNTKTITWPSYSVPSLDNVCDVDSTTDQTITAANFITAGDYNALANSGIYFGDNKIDTIDYTSSIADFSSKLLIKTADRNGSGSNDGPTVLIDVGNGNGSGDGGDFQVTAGVGGTSGGDGGTISLSSGRYDNNSHSGASAYLFGGSSTGGGNATINGGGASSASKAGGSVSINSGSGRNSSDASVPGSAFTLNPGLATGVGGSSTLTAGNGTGSNIAGGDITIKAGAGTGNADPGQIIFQASTAVLGSGSTTQTLQTKATIDNNGLTLTDALGETSGGTGQNAYAEGDILYASASNTLSRLAKGTNGHFLKLVNGVPTWAADNYEPNTDTKQSISDTTFNAWHYISFVSNTSGAQTGLVSSSGLQYNPYNKRLKISSLDGIDSDLTSYTDFKWSDNYKAKFGTGSDMAIYHDGSHNFVESNNGVLLRVKGTDQTGSANGGSVQIEGGNGGETSGDGGNATINSGASYSSSSLVGIGGWASFQGATSSGGGDASIYAGTGSGNNTTGGIARLFGGDGKKVDGSTTFGCQLYVYPGYNTGEGGGATLVGGRSVGTNIAGADIVIKAGRGTGSAGAGDIIFYTGSPQSSGSTQHPELERVRINESGLIATQIYTSQYITHLGDGGTEIEFTSDRVKINAGGVEMIDCVEGATDYVDIVDTVRITKDGDLECENDIISETTTSISDINYKDNLVKIDNALEKVTKLNGYTFNWKSDGDTSAGIIAQEVEEVLPEIVKEKSIRDGDPRKTVEYNGLVGMLIEAMKEQQEQIEALKSEIDELKAK